jgi:hypothetical protein
MGPSNRWILVHNDTHINAMHDTFGCASGLVQQFVSRPGALRRLNAACTKRTPEVRVVGSFPVTLSVVTPASPLPGNRAATAGLQLAAVGAAATGDAIWHWYYGDGSHGWGLRGGKCRFSGPAGSTRISFHGVRWTIDTRVNGYALWNRRAGRVVAHLTVDGPSGNATIQVAYPDYVAHALATVTGSYLGSALAGVLPAP